MKPPVRWISPDTTSAALFVQKVKKAGSRNLVDELMDPFRLLVETGNAPADVVAAVRLFQTRPFYSAQELCRIWPLVCVGLTGKKMAWRPDAARLHKRLVECKLPRLRNYEGGFDYAWQGVARQYFPVQDVQHWRKVRVSQRQFEEMMK